MATRSAARAKQQNRRRRQTRHSTRRQAILDAAAAEFAEAGYERATLDRIGERVGLSKGSLYYYVDSKEQLLTDLLQRVVAEIEQRASELSSEDASPSERLRAFVAAHMSLGGARPEGKILTENLTALTASPAAADFLHRHESSIAAILSDGVADGSFRDVPIAATVKLLLGSLNAIPRWFDPGGSLELDQITELASDFFLRAILSKAP